MVATSFANSPMPQLPSSKERCDSAAHACVCAHNLLCCFLGFSQLHLERLSESLFSRPWECKGHLDTADLVGKFADFIGSVLNVLDLSAEHVLASTSWLHTTTGPSNADLRGHQFEPGVLAQQR